jgi:hypothetical protein
VRADGAAAEHETTTASSDAATQRSGDTASYETTLSHSTAGSIAVGPGARASTTVLHGASPEDVRRQVADVLQERARAFSKIVRFVGVAAGGALAIVPIARFYQYPCIEDFQVLLAKASLIAGLSLATVQVFRTVRIMLIWIAISVVAGLIFSRATNWPFVRSSTQEIYCAYRGTIRTMGTNQPLAGATIVLSTGFSGSESLDCKPAKTSAAGDFNFAHCNSRRSLIDALEKRRVTISAPSPMNPDGPLLSCPGDDDPRHEILLFRWPTPTHIRIDLDTCSRHTEPESMPRPQPTPGEPRPRPILDDHKPQPTPVEPRPPPTSIEHLRALDAGAIGLSNGDGVSWSSRYWGGGPLNEYGELSPPTEASGPDDETFPCRTGRPIQALNVCDGYPNCPEGEDEAPEICTHTTECCKATLGCATESYLSAGRFCSCCPMGSRCCARLGSGCCDRLGHEY